MGSKTEEAARTCPRCSASVTPTQVDGDDGVVWLWRCTCGWAGARTESGVVDRRQVNDIIERATKKTGDD